MRGCRDKFGRVRFWCTLTFLWLLVFSSLLSADEIDKLIEEVRPGANFAIHTANFSAAQEEFTFDSNEGQIERSLWVIKDRDRYVAVWHEEGSKLYMVAANPARASTTIKMPPRYNAGGNTFDGKLGVRVTTFPYCYGFIQAADNRRFKFNSGWGTLTLTDTSIWTREHKTEAVYALTFRCDPVLGYVVDMDVQFKTDQETDENGNPFEPELVNLYPNHTFMAKMPDAEWRYEYTVYTPPNCDKYVGWINDFTQSDPADGVKLRNGGFSLFLFDPDWQGPALTCTVDEGINLRNATYNLQYDQHHLVSLPKGRDINGFFKVNAKFRLVFLPREITTHIMDKVELTDWRSNDAFPIRIGETEDFETDRLPKIPEYAKGYRALRLSEEEAHSGGKSFVVDGERRFRIDPQPVFEPNATYILEAWVKVALGSSNDAEAYLLAQPSQWIPKGTELEPHQSASVKAGEEWRKITLEFENGPLGATYRLYAVAKGNRPKAYFDDVRIMVVSTPTDVLFDEFNLDEIR
ncbi:MAG: hypothetical protein FVQ85_15210 [Planctomycetes bacterium]|nr:hypothetical protein [Planctomycetota bacterium]